MSRTIPFRQVGLLLVAPLVSLHAQATSVHIESRASPTILGRPCRRLLFHVSCFRAAVQLLLQPLEIPRQRVEYHHRNGT